jgi:hypothetical protein
MEQNNANQNQGGQSPSAANNPQQASGAPATPNNNQNQQKPNQQQPKPMNNQQKPNQPKNGSAGNNNALWWIIAVIIIIAVIAVATKRKHAPQPAPAVPEASQTQGDESVAPTATDSDNETSAFTEAIKNYSGKSVILGVNEKKECVALPQKLAVAAGTRVLIANNSAQQLSVEVSDKKVDLDAYHYFTVALGNALEYSVICEGQSDPVSSIEIK